MLHMTSISTERLHARDKIAQWQQSAWLETGHAQSRLVQATSFDGFLEYGSLDEIRLYRLSVTPHQITSSPGMGHHPPRGLVKVVLQVKGTTLYEQMGRQVLLEPGSWMLRDLDLPYIVNILEPCELIVAMLPRSSITSGRFEIRDLCLRRFSGTSGLGHVVHDMIRTTYQEFETLDESMAPDLSSTMTQLIRLQLLQMCTEQSPQSLGEVLQARIKRHIASHLRAPDLSLNQIARAMRCTKRYLHKAFENEDVSIAGYILNKRLDRCRDDLQRASLRDESITNIALSWGFNSGAHFSRTFHKRFHFSPSDFRALAISGTRELE
jgi:AraC-like DNA-binding protein